MRIVIAFVVFASCLSQTAAADPRLELIQKRGFLNCGVWQIAGASRVVGVRRDQSGWQLRREVRKNIGCASHQAKPRPQSIGARWRADVCAAAKVSNYPKVIAFPNLIQYNPQTHP